jgi:Mrp family chromosome partitioning ATPase
MDALIHKIMDPMRLQRQREPMPPPEAGAENTVVFIHSVLTLDERQRERERILPPGAPEPVGGPYKMLRTQVLRRLSQIDANSLAVLSAGKGEGKTLTAINLAIAVAADARHTALLVDLDLRNPSIARRLGYEPVVGIEDCLRGRRPVYEAMARIAGYERLMVLPARGPVEQSSELLASQRTGELIHELRTRYPNRILIFDLPPVLLADDALAFSRHVEAGLLIVAECASERESIKRSLTLLDKLPIVGTVLNRSRERLEGYY